MENEREIQLRIADIQKQMAAIKPLDDYNRWLDLNNTLKDLNRRLGEMKSQPVQTASRAETVEERLLREAKERYERRREDAGNNWWANFD